MNAGPVLFVIPLANLAYAVKKRRYLALPMNELNTCLGNHFNLSVKRTEEFAKSRPQKFLQSLVAETYQNDNYSCLKGGRGCSQLTKEQKRTRWDSHPIDRAFASFGSKIHDSASKQEALLSPPLSLSGARTYLYRYKNWRAIISKTAFSSGRVLFAPL